MGEKLTLQLTEISLISWSCWRIKNTNWKLIKTVIKIN